MAPVAIAVAGGVGALVIVFCGELLSWAGIPAIGAAALGAAGVLASQGVLTLWSVLVVGALGAWTGGLIGWRIGRWLAVRAPGLTAAAPPTGPEAESAGRRRMVERGRKAIASGERLQERVGGVMVFFVPSWVSGRLGMPLRRFALWNVGACVLWTTAAGLGAYGVGSAFSGRSLAHVIAPIAVAAIAFGLIGWAFSKWRRSREGRRTLHRLVDS
jgi:membrane protein DedA with SNARE-associated domain